MLDLLYLFLASVPIATGLAFQRTKILCVDDDDVLLASLSSLLSAHDF